MKYLSLFIISSLLLLVSCQEKSSKKKSVDCNYNYYQQGCPGFNQYGTTGGFTGTTTGGVTGGTTGGGFTGTTTGGVTGGTTGQINNPYWGEQYPGGVPSGNCTDARAPQGASYTPYDTRKATVTMAGNDTYDPANSETQNAYNTSSILKTVSQAKTLYQTDSILKVRFKVRQQPDVSKSTFQCYGRAQGQSTIPGYTKLMFTVNVVGWDINNNRSVEPVDIVTVGVNSCSAGIDLSRFASRFPNGMYVQISDVFANQNCWWDSNGFTNCNAFKLVREADCWAMDIEVAADGTKTFD